jgi:diguanylate cyclase (GGDEF)-like protein
MPLSSHAVFQAGRRTSLGTRLVALVLGVVALLLLASALAVQLGTRSLVSEIANADLETAERVWVRFYELRGRRLLSAVSVLAEDFGFREAVTADDGSTGLSALLNHAGRVDADLAVLLTPSGEPTVLVPNIGLRELRPALDALLAQPGADRGVIGTVIVDGMAMQLALVPVRAPGLVAWAGFGFAISDEVLRDYSGLTGIDLRLLADGGGVEIASSHEAGDRGLHRIARADRLALAGGEELLLRFELDEARITEPLERLRRRILLLSLAMAVPAALLALMAANGISRPLQRLTELVARIASGDYGSRVEVRGQDEVGRLAQGVAAMQEAIQSREARIEQQALTDGLTGLANRASALRVLAGIGSSGRTEARRLTLLDIRRFSEVNDAFGPEVGDRLLALVAMRLRELCPERLIARLGANEFMLLGASDADLLAELQALNWLSELQAPYEISGASLRLEFCAAWAEYPSQSSNGLELLRRAQLALADAKREGLAICGYRQGSEDRHLRQLRLMADLRQATERTELHLVFQPKVDLRTGRVVHAEALLRWRHPQLGPIGPDEFVPLAERSGLVSGLTRFVLKASLESCLEWQKAGLDLAVAVNLSALDLGDAGLAPRVEAMLAEVGLASTRLILEVTESAIVRDVARAIEQLQRLRELGVRVAVDDFGTGQSSLAQLQRLPTDELKIDKSFVLGLAAGGADAQIVRLAVELGHSLGLQVIAEGVETAAGLAVLRSVGCDIGQGYLFSRPLSSAALVDWTRNFDFSALALPECPSP